MVSPNDLIALFVAEVGDSRGEWQVGTEVGVEFDEACLSSVLGKAVAFDCPCKGFRGVVVRSFESTYW